MSVLSISLFSVLIFFSIITDLKFKKIYNYITFPAIILGVVANCYLLGPSGLIFSGKGLLLGLIIFMPFFFVGYLGAGDVKLMGAIGAILGVKMAFYTATYAILAGGIIAFFVLLYQGHLPRFSKQIYYWFLSIIFRKTFQGYLSVESSLKTPFAVAIAIGGIIAMNFNFLEYLF